MDSPNSLASSSSSSQPHSTTPDSPNSFRYLTKHLNGELLVTPEKASEAASDLAVSKNQQQKLHENLQMASETCITLMIHPNFKPDSPLQSILDSSSSGQIGSELSVSISEEYVHVVQPLNASLRKNTLQSSLEILTNKPSVLEPILEPVIQPATPSLS